jgi:hypothetical protein
LNQHRAIRWHAIGRGGASYMLGIDM